MWFQLFVVSLQLVPFMAMRMFASQAKLLDETSVEQEGSPAEVVEKAQKRFAKLNTRFESKLRRLDEAKSAGQDISTEESEEVEKAHQAADQAHASLDRAVAALKAADAGESNELPVLATVSETSADRQQGRRGQVVEKAQEQFARLNARFERKLQKLEEAKTRGEEVSAEESEEVEKAHNAADQAHASLDKAVAALKGAGAGVSNELPVLATESETSAEHQDGPGQGVVTAQERFAKLNEIFTDKLERVNEAKARGEEVSAEEIEEVQKAHQAADDAHFLLDMSVSDLEASGAAHAKLSDARKHLSTIDKEIQEALFIRRHH